MNVLQLRTTQMGYSDIYGAAEDNDFPTFPIEARFFKSIHLPGLNVSGIVFLTQKIHILSEN